MAGQQPPSLDHKVCALYLRHLRANVPQPKFVNVQQFGIDWDWALSALCHYLSPLFDPDDTEGFRWRDGAWPAIVAGVSPHALAAQQGGATLLARHILLMLHIQKASLCYSFATVETVLSLAKVHPDIRKHRRDRKVRQLFAKIPAPVDGDELVVVGYIFLWGVALAFTEVIREFLSVGGQSLEEVCGRLGAEGATERPLCRVGTASGTSMHRAVVTLAWDVVRCVEGRLGGPGAVRSALEIPEFRQRAQSVWSFARAAAWPLIERTPTTICTTEGLAALDREAVLLGKRGANDDTGLADPWAARISFDRVTRTVTIDGKVIPVQHDKAYALFERIIAGRGTVVSRGELNSLPGCKGRPNRFLAFLPPALKSLYESKCGHGGGFIARLPRPGAKRRN